jgi:hypothetical protein
MRVKAPWHRKWAKMAWDACLWWSGTSTETPVSPGNVPGRGHDRRHAWSG